jgi:Mn-dependent DtxR family transcriptional regulator
MGEIARKIDRDKSTVTSLVRKLAELGYVRSGPSPSDSRMTMVMLTEKGGALENDFKEVSAMLKETIYRGGSLLEKEILARLLTRARDSLESKRLDSVTQNEKRSPIIRMNQFYGATQIVDLYHAREHYWSVAKAYSGQHKDKLHQWTEECRK